MLASLLENPLFADEYARHERARFDNARLLGERLDELRQGKALDALEPFAKAYLGMFEDIDSNVAAQDRFYLLANEEIVDAVKQGLAAVLSAQAFPSPQEIALSMVEESPLGVGYIALAAIDLYVRSGQDVQQLPEDSIKSVICFHYANSTFHQDDWLAPLLEGVPAVAGQALIELWQVLRDRGFTYLPGMQMVMDNAALAAMRARVMIPAVKMLRNKRPKELAKMLLVALQSTDKDALFECCKDVLQDSDQIGIRQQVYWQATAFILQPAARANILNGFVGHEKIKILPLLDFTSWAMKDAKQALSAEAIGELIRIIAPKFTPQLDRFGELSEISLKVAWLFYQLAIQTTLPAMQTTKKLKRVRVLKLYNEVFEEIEALQLRLAKNEGPIPSAEEFIQGLHASGKLKSKKNWSDKTQY